MTGHVSHVGLTSHPGFIFKEALPIQWGAEEPMVRGPIVASMTHRQHRNAIGTHSGSYSVYRALATAAGDLTPEHRPDLTNTNPVVDIGPFPSWRDPEKMVSIDPWGAQIATVFREHLDKGYDIRPTIAVTKAHMLMPEITEAIEKGRLQIDGTIIRDRTSRAGFPDHEVGGSGGDVGSGATRRSPSDRCLADIAVTKAALDPVWYLPGIAQRFGVDEGELRRVLFEETGGMFPELITRPDLKVLLPPIGSTTVYMFGDPRKISDPTQKLTLRVHDECNGSDVFGSDICTCRPYLCHGIEEAVRSAQEGGSGVIVYYRKEGRALGEVTKFLVYNARKRQEGGDSAATYFHRTECVAGVQDMRFQELMPDALHWLGITKIDRLISMSDMKYDAITKSGIRVLERVSIPDGLIPQDAQVEMEAKKAAGYFTSGEVKNSGELQKVKGRGLHE